MHVQVQDQVEDAKVARNAEGALTLYLRPGLVSSDAFVALVLALEVLPEERHEYLHRTG